MTCNSNSKLVGDNVSPPAAPRAKKAKIIACANSSTIPGQLAGFRISDCLTIELCAGSAGLSSSLRSCGFQVLPVDHKSNRHIPKVSCVNIDLTNKSAISILIAVVNHSNAVYVHCAPPCGTSSRARERPVAKHLIQMGAPNPRPLRSDEFPAGLPGLTPNEQARVDAANSIYRLVEDVVAYALFRQIMFSVENPTRSIYWLFGKMPSLRARTDVEVVDFQACMHGGDRDKWSTWMCSRGLLSSMRLKCDGSHQHKPWGFVQGSSDWQFATAQEAEYSKQLCDTVAHLVLEKCVLMGAVEPAVTISGVLSSDQANMLARSRNHKQARGRKIPPLVSEFKCVEEYLTKPAETQHHLRVLRQFTRATSGTSNTTELPQAQVYIVGELRDPESFLEEAKVATHPIEMQRIIPDVTLQAIFDILTKGPVGISKHRLSALQEVRTLREQLCAKEKALHDRMPNELQKVLHGKQLLLFGKLLEDSGYPDKDLVKDITKGFRLIGVTPTSHVLPSRIVAATLTAEDLASRAKVLQTAIAQGGHVFADNDMCKAVHEQTLEEVGKGWLSGPFTMSQISEQLGPHWIPSRRFGIRQGSKVRPIDDASESGVNDCLTSTEKLQLMGVDFVADVAMMIRTCVEKEAVTLKLSDDTELRGSLHKDWPDQESPFQWLGRTLDLKSAYKQLGINPEDYWCSVLVVANPDSKCDDLFISRSLLFGATSSVYSFNRVARALWFLASKLFALVAGQFYDDFPCMEPRASASLAKSTFQSFLDLLGWQWSGGDKDLPFLESFTALGVVFDLSHIQEGFIEVLNKADRVEAIESRVKEIVGKGNILRSEASELQGRLQFASAQVMGRSILPAMRVLAMCTSFQKPSWGSIRCSLLSAIENLKLSPCRRIHCKTGIDKCLLIFTDGAWESGLGTWGFLIWDCANGRSYVAGGDVPQGLIALWTGMVGEQLIGQIELWPVVFIRMRLNHLVLGRKILWFIDNESAKEALVRAFSNSPCSAALVQEFYSFENKSATSSWFSRVPSFSNPADMPSRRQVKECADLFHSEIVTIAVLTASELDNIVSRTNSYVL